MIPRFVTWAKGYYIKGGKPTSELGNAKVTMRLLKELYGLTPANEFSPIKLKALREGFIGHGYCRSECNRRCMIIKRLFRLAVEYELVPDAVHSALTKIAGRSKGHSAAKERPTPRRRTWSPPCRSCVSPPRRRSGSYP